MRVGVLVSGRGSNLAALLGDAAREDAPYEVALVLSNRPEAPALERARAAGITALGIDRVLFKGRQARHLEVLRLLREHEVELVVCAGFDQILIPAVVKAYTDRILNVHPSLLPAFAGTLHAQEEALAYGVKVSGCTVHLVTADPDAGPIVAQGVVPVEEGDTAETLSARILEQEHRLLPHAVRLIAAGRVRVEGRRAVILPPS